LDCPNCKKSNPEDARYCAYCGAVLAPELSRGVGSRYVTCLAADVLGFSKMDGTVPRSKMAVIKHNCLTAIHRQVEYFGGTTVGYHDSGLEAVFGAPATWERDTELAVLAAIALTEEITAISESISGEYGFGITARTGIDVGRIEYENIPGESTLTAAGATLDYAIRLKDSARPNGILVSHEAYDYVRNYFEFRPYVFSGTGLSDAPVTSYVIQRRKPMSVPTQLLARGQFISRKDELHRLSSKVEKGLSGEGSATVIIGEAGMGKTRIVAETLNIIGAELVFWTRYLPRSNVLSYLPFRHFLSDLFDSKPGIEIAEKARDFLSEDGGELRDYVSLLGIIFDRDFGEIPGESSLSEGKKSKTLFKLVLKIIELAAAQKPFVLVFENVHWADEKSLDLTRFLIPQLKGLGIACVITARNTANLTGMPYDDIIYLKPLVDKDIEEIARRIIKEERWDETVKDKILSLSHGNPMYAEEFARAMATGDRSDPVEIPAAVRINIQARLDRLSDHSLSLLKLAACIGDSFSINLLRELSGLMPGDFFEALYGLSLEGLIYIHEDKVRIRSPIITDIIEQGLFESYKVLIHGDIADHLSARGGDPVMIAYHLATAGRKTEAARYLVNSAGDALKDLTFDDALSYYLKANELIEDDSLKNTGYRFPVERIVDLFVELGKREEALSFVEKKFKRAKTAESKARSLHLTGRVYRKSGEPEKALVYLDEAGVLYRSLNDKEGQAAVDIDKAFSFFKLDSLTEAETLAKSGQGLYEEAGDDGLANVYHLLSLTSLAQGDAEKALRYIEDGDKLWSKSRGLPGTATTYDLTARALKNQGRISEAITFAEKSMELAEKSGKSELHITVAVNYARLLVHNGKIRQAIDLLVNKALPLTRVIKYKDNVGAVNNVLCLAYLAAREYERAVTAGEKALDCAEEIGAPKLFSESLSKIIQAKSTGGADMTAEIERLEKPSGVWVTRPGLVRSVMWELRSHTAIAERDLDNVRRAIQEGQIILADKTDALEKYETELLLAELEELSADQSPAKKRYQSLIKSSRKNGARYCEGLACYGLARLYTGTKDRGNAAKFIRSMEKIFGGQGVDRWEAVINSLKTELEGA
jgi:class 3 adenylate cyclase/tetratricopeptide (TPR) repeat protein